ncbi:MAG TPA: hypothetical protein VFL86_07040 [Burkholderiaceae bacterium]|nr:hypothetical protein [Burkholderiaceae bacterium]
MKDPTPRDPRYAPPSTDVADPALLPALPARPRQVQIAVGLLWLSLVLSLPEAVLSNQQAGEDGMGVAMVVSLVLIFGFIGFLNVRIYQGRNWARIVVLLLTALSVVMMLFPSAEQGAEGPLVQGLYLFDVLIEVVAIYLVFSKPGSLWFKPPQ